MARIWRTAQVSGQEFRVLGLRVSGLGFRAGVIKGDVRSLDYTSHGAGPRIWVLCFEKSGKDMVSGLGFRAGALLRFQAKSFGF